MTVFAYSKTHIYIDDKGWLLSFMLNHSPSAIANSFPDLPFYNNEDEVRAAYPDLR